MSDPRKCNIPTRNIKLMLAASYTFLKKKKKEEKDYNMDGHCTRPPDLLEGLKEKMHEKHLE